MREKNIIIFGTGSISKLLVDNIRDDTCIVAYLANDEDRKSINDIPVIGFSDLDVIEYDYIVIAFGNSMRGVGALINCGVPREKIVAYTYCGTRYEDSFFQNKLDEIFEEKLKTSIIPELFSLPQKRHFLCSMNMNENYGVIARDFVREQTLVFLGEEIKRRGVKGNVAEIGVANGEFASKISKVFPDRYIYLFDTFCGLTDIDKNKAIELGWGERSYAIGEKGTHEEEVIKCMPNPELCVVKKGVFPESFDLRDNLAFVSLDIDFYDSTERGLEVIYPHVAAGGYIMIHDYNNIAFQETRQAVVDFCDANGVNYVPIPDCGGSVVIAKSYM